LGHKLGRRAEGRTLYLLDEPTTGLHLADAAHLLVLLQRLVDGGNSVVVVGYNLDLVKAAGSNWLSSACSVPKISTRAGALCSACCPSTGFGSPRDRTPVHEAW
jgi:ABC-type cobalamin transport system ATPase subunit